MCDRREALDILGSVYDRCAPILPITDAYLYGSYARGDYDSESDVDIMLVSSLPKDEIWPLRRRVSQIANELSTDHDISVSVCVRSREQFQPKALPYYQNVVNDGIRYSPV